MSTVDKPGNKVMLNADNLSAFGRSLCSAVADANTATASSAIGIVLLWAVTKHGSRSAWAKLRLIAAVSMPVALFLALTRVLFATYFDTLVELTLSSNATHSFLKDKGSTLVNSAKEVVAVALNAQAITLVSFTLVFLFHGVGSGLYCGTALYRQAYFARTLF